jgi:hypothetical protein
MNITEKQFNDVVDKHKPNKAMTFWWNSFWADGWNSWKILLGIIFILFNCIAIYYESIPLRGFIYFASLSIANGSLALVVLFGFFIITWNNLRLRKIRKELGVTNQEYDELISWYGK